MIVEFVFSKILTTFCWPFLFLFLEELFVLVGQLNQEESSVGCWNEEGDRFIVNDLDKFKKIVKTKFICTSHTAFRRQLSEYGFSAREAAGKNQMEFFHSGNLFGREATINELQKIRGKSSKQSSKTNTKKSTKQDESTIATTKTEKPNLEEIVWSMAETIKQIKDILDERLPVIHGESVNSCCDRSCCAATSATATLSSHSFFSKESLNVYTDNTMPFDPNDTDCKNFFNDFTFFDSPPEVPSATPQPNASQECGRNSKENNEENGSVNNEEVRKVPKRKFSGTKNVGDHEDHRSGPKDKDEEGDGAGPFGQYGQNLCISSPSRTQGVGGGNSTASSSRSGGGTSKSARKNSENRFSEGTNEVKSAEDDISNQPKSSQVEDGEAADGRNILADSKSGMSETKTDPQVCTLLDEKKTYKPRSEAKTMPNRSGEKCQELIAFEPKSSKSTRKDASEHVMPEETADRVRQHTEQELLKGKVKPFVKRSYLFIKAICEDERSAACWNQAGDQVVISDLKRFKVLLEQNFVSRSFDAFQRNLEAYGFKVHKNIVDNSMVFSHSKKFFRRESKIDELKKIRLSVRKFLFKFPPKASDKALLLKEQICFESSNDVRNQNSRISQRDTQALLEIESAADSMSDIFTWSSPICTTSSSSHNSVSSSSRQQQNKAVIVFFDHDQADTGSLNGPLACAGKVMVPWDEDVVSFREEHSNNASVRSGYAFDSICQNSKGQHWE